MYEGNYELISLIKIVPMFHSVTVMSKTEPALAKVLRSVLSSLGTRKMTRPYPLMLDFEYTLKISNRICVRPCARKKQYR
jgi:hypothetical protein